MKVKAVSGIMQVLLFIGMLTFANLNVTSTGATGTEGSATTGTGAGNSGTTMTLKSNVTMQFENSNFTWIGSGLYLEIFNETKGENITQIKPGTRLSAKGKIGWWFVPPTTGSWWYVYGTLYGLYIAFHVDYVEKIGELYYFNISETYDYWLRAPMNFTFELTPVTTFEVELMIETLETGFDYMAWVDFVFYTIPTVDSLWSITYPDVLWGVQFHINEVSLFWMDPDTGDEYWLVCFDELLDAAGNPVDSVPVPPPIPIEGIEAMRITGPAPPPVIAATIDINPDTFSLICKGEWVTCYIELPEGYDVSDIDICSIRLNDTFPVSLLVVPPVPVPTEIGDYDEDGTPDLMVKFNMTELTSYIRLQGIKYGNVTLKITGNLTDGTQFEGEDTVKVLLPGDLDHDGDIDATDFIDFCGAYPSNPPLNPEADLDSDGDVDRFDFVLLVGNYGRKL